MGFFFPVFLLQASPRNQPDNCTLPAPSSLNTTALGSTTATIAWSGVANAFAYHIRIYTLPEGNLISDFLSFDLNTTLSGLNSGASYRCAVSAVCNGDAPGSEVENSIVIDIVLNNSSPGNEAAGTHEHPQPAPVFSFLENPFSGVLRFSVDAGAPLPYHLQMISADGRLVLEQNGIASPAELVSVATPDLASGLYFVRVETGGMVQVFRLFRQ